MVISPHMGQRKSAGVCPSSGGDLEQNKAAQEILCAQLIESFRARGRAHSDEEVFNPPLGCDRRLRPDGRSARRVREQLCEVCESVLERSRERKTRNP